MDMMPRRVFSFDRPDRFVCGAVGQPGQRTFFLQAAKGEQVVSVALEKTQVAVLAERLATLLLALRQGGVAIGEEPRPGHARSGRAGRRAVPRRHVDPRLGRRRRAHRHRGARADRRRRRDDETRTSLERGRGPPSGWIRHATSATAPTSCASSLSPTAALAFASGAVAVVQAGRPPCPQCGAPLDPTGHFCPRRNGYTH